MTTVPGLSPPRVAGGPVDQGSGGEPVTAQLDRTRARLSASGAVSDQEGKPFLDEGNALLGQADAAVKRGDPVAARQLVEGADSFSHVVEHLDRARNPGKMATMPPPIARPGPLGDEGVPPPPAPAH